MARRQDRRAEIARAAIAPLSSQGVHHVRLADLGASLGMTGAHLLYYFESKNDLFLAALRTVEQDLRDRVLERFATIDSARDRWQWLVETGAPTGLDDSGLLMWLEAWAGAVHDDDVLALITELESAWQGLLRDTLGYAVARGELPPGIDVDPIVEGVSALLDGLTLRVVVGYRPLDRAAALAIVDRFVAPLLPWKEPA
ncbi:TetR family transcriptional regulator C-terminal domain-containing protein [Nocardioides mangrovi]|uniref:TetR family transcriptional regulator C-terminal domain-containing protein n=1 Tax=Nocardioides mangrovi TaxID=2874580 RepID=A0ABS7UE26_9ACTN|nr:TetR family transcriptional regulator C-terminal domain-containing protein [Nocardioides mangrovi]MBZ5739253.1 TetR family transcriptional regulator C-terminal domain-containing protein [Nocardioides mangrovi]